jgi:hypothetical protein
VNNLLRVVLENPANPAICAVHSPFIRRAKMWRLTAPEPAQRKMPCRQPIAPQQFSELIPAPVTHAIMGCRSEFRAGNFLAFRSDSDQRVAGKNRARFFEIVGYLPLMRTPLSASNTCTSSGAA